jgi:hypothetical protein
VAQVMANRDDGKTEHTETQNINERIEYVNAGRAKDDDYDESIS